MALSYPKTEIFSVDSDLSDGERLLVASYMTEIAKGYELDDPNRARLLKNEAQRYCACSRQGIRLQCPLDYLRYYIRVFCYSRLCEKCGRLYVKTLQETILPVVRAIEEKDKRGYVLAQVTLTVTSKRYGNSLPDRAGIARLYRESTSLLRRFYGKFALKKSKTGKWHEDRKRYIGAGWLAALEVGKDNNNLHIHALVYGPIRSQELLRKAWIDITGDSFGVDIRKKSPKDAVAYVLKYIAKPPTTDSYERMAEYADMIKGSRRFRSGGVLYNRFKRVKKEPKPCTCIVCGSILRYETVIDSIFDCGDIDLRRVQRDPDGAYTSALVKNAGLLPGGITPVSLPF
jgi:hypothetical protein